MRYAQSDISEGDVEKWNLIRDKDGLMRVFARLSAVGNLEFFRVFLPQENYITKLLIMKIHKKLLHPVVSHTLASFRNHYWVERGRGLVRRLLFKNSLRCKKYAAKPFKFLLMPNLPPDKANKSRPFECTRVDAGSFSVQTTDDKLIKIWVALFTCLTTRAVHLEFVKSQTVFDFVNAFKRFTARRACPESLVSTPHNFR